MSAAVEFQNVSFNVGEQRLLNDISLSLEEGTTTAVLGRSGSGKTTLLRTVNRMVEPTAGAVIVRGRSTRGADLIALRRSMGYVIQETGLFPHLNVERNVGVVLEAMGRPRAERVERSHSLLEAVGLDPARFARRFPNQLSGGQRQRVGLARALAAEPGILLMDEPFGALDAMTREQMNLELLRIWSQNRKTVFFITHSIAEAIFLADRVIAMTARPGSIADIIAIDLPRPRDLSIINTDRFGHYAARLRGLLDAQGGAF
jgi:ABC-type proline/glycine betaine transport system ATPase subunit